MSLEKLHESLGTIDSLVASNNVLTQVFDQFIPEFEKVISIIRDVNKAKAEKANMILELTDYSKKISKDIKPYISTFNKEMRELAL